jgi:hypothetical protein
MMVATTRTMIKEENRIYSFVIHDLLSEEPKSWKMDRTDYFDQERDGCLRNHIIGYCCFPGEPDKEALD